MSGRRELVFDSWDEILADLDALQAGYSQHRTWDLAQTSKHLRDWATFPIAGFPKAPIPIRCIMWIVRNTIGPRQLKGILSSKKMGDAMPTDPKTVYSPEKVGSEEEEVALLRQAVEGFRHHDGIIHTSPIFGSMDKETAEALQFVHFAHHLSWLEPTNAS